MNLRGRINQRLFDTASVWAVRTNNRVTLVSANDHGHARNSGHYEDRALDLHSTDNDSLAQFLQQWNYLIYWRVPGHYNHVHVEELDGT